MKNSIIIILIAFISLYSYANCDGAENIEKIIKGIAKDLNSQMPIMLDSETRIDMILATGKTLNYKYTMVNMNVDEVNIPQFKKDVHAFIVKSICSQHEVIDLLKKGVVYNSILSDGKGYPITTNSITIKDCR